MGKFIGIMMSLSSRMWGGNRVSIGAQCNLSFPFSIKCHKKASLHIGHDFKARSNFCINLSEKGNLKIGNNVFFNRGCSINCRANVIIGDNCIFGENVLVYDHDHHFNCSMGLKDGYALGAVKIGKGCWIGAGTIILKGVNIGDNVLISAGSLVKRDIPSNSLFYNKRENAVIRDFNNDNK